ncbi:MAG TPA: hypothetical protein VEU77_04185 [Candidatus Acidoferrales bacterium]|nr:hypothetical protein [Candidatus Acidoferrales bacterium]
MDVGAGDAHHSLWLARSRPDVFAVAIEPSRESLRDAARSLTRRPLPNIALIANAVEQCADLGPLADEVTVTLPWGALLEALLGRHADVLGAMAAISRPGATLRAIVSLTDRDGHGAMPAAATLCEAYRDAEFDDLVVRPATADDVAAARSSWGKRLGVGRVRPAFVLRATRR